MAIYPKLPRTHCVPVLPALRRLPVDEPLRVSSHERLVAPQMARIRVEVPAWCTTGFSGASNTAREMLRWWFETNLPPRVDVTIEAFCWYFAPCEPVETVVWRFDVHQPREVLELPRKIARLAQWCEDAPAGSAEKGGWVYRFICFDKVWIN